MQIPVNLLREIDRTAPLDELETNSFLKKAQTATAPELDPVEHILKRRTMLSMVAPEDVETAFERYLGTNDLLPLNYLQLGFLKSYAVGRIRFIDAVTLRPAVATGFLVSQDLIMTNHHVFSNPGTFQEPYIEFDYSYDLNGNEREKITFQLNPRKFFYANAGLDLCLIGVEKKDLKGIVDIASRGYLVMNPSLGKAGNGDYAGIIQHPEGQPMQVAIRENKFTDVLSDSIFLYYSADTSFGSSGSPVFNDQWQLIALHSAGTAKKDAAGNYIDIDGNVIPIDPITNKVDSAKVVWVNNRGVRVSAMWSLINTDPAINSHPFILALKSPNYSDERSFLQLSLPIVEAERFVVAKSNLIGAPTSVALTPQSSISNIHLHIHLGNEGQISIPSATTSNLQVALGGIEFEKKIEDEINYSLCQGFDPFFMGIETPLPKLGEKLKKKVAFLLDNPNAYVLKYHHYSTVQHAVRRMPVYSAINILGKKRFDLDRGTDIWFRDRRIDFDVQLNDKFYAHSKMDKGHMARREDAEWGNNIESAKLSADMTCCYTNACPQVPSLNRSTFRGEWGNLEFALLEQGVTNESGEQGKINVYNGPIFHDEDPVFKGIQVPMDYFKVVIWRDKDNQLRSTGFILTQKDLVGDVDFEALHFEDIFTHRQVPITEIERRTFLDFQIIKTWDTN